jgi:hypothetical protein
MSPPNTTQMQYSIGKPKSECPAKFEDCSSGVRACEMAGVLVAFLEARGP